jgi:cytochrome c peroxidase
VGVLEGSGCARRVDRPHRNPAPVELARPAVAPLSAAAQLGRALFFDPTLSGSGRLSCSSCHDPAHAYAAPNDRAVQLGGVDGNLDGLRAVPSLRYLYRVPGFAIGPDLGETEHPPPPPPPAAPGQRSNAKTAATAAAAVVAMVPMGGLFWDGRVSRLLDQARVPLLNPLEMANRAVASVAARLRQPPYASQLAALYGPTVLRNDGRLVDEAMSAVARFEIEDSSFHPFSSKYDAWLEGRAALSPAEWRGLQAFEDPERGNCAACHLDRPGPDGRPPVFSDFQYEALGVPRNLTLPVNRDTAYYDLGLCGPIRTDFEAERQYCGMFRTPSLRNVATRRVFFHNGVYHSLQDVLRFYNLRAVDPAAIYPRGEAGSIALFNDLPAADRANVDTVDAPFTRARGARPPMSDQDISDIIAFLQTLTDGYRAVSDSSRAIRP